MDVQKRPTAIDLLNDPFVQVRTSECVAITCNSECAVCLHVSDVHQTPDFIKLSMCALQTVALVF